MAQKDIHQEHEIYNQNTEYHISFKNKGKTL
jgi:hypothetical protein